MCPLVGMMEKPGKGFQIKISSFEGDTESNIISVEKIGFSIQNALVVGIMIAVMSDDEDKIFQEFLAEGKMPIELCSPLSVIMGHQLSVQNRIRCEENDVFKSEVPSVLWSAEIIVAGESAWILKMPEDLSVQGDLFFSAERFFLEVGAVYENFSGVGCIQHEKKREYQ